MSLDIEGGHTVDNSRIEEIGVSLLDTRQLVEKSELISSRHICTWYGDKSFLFGDSEYPGNKNLGTLIKSLFYIEDIDQSVSLCLFFRQSFRADFTRRNQASPLDLKMMPQVYQTKDIGTSSLSVIIFAMTSQC